MVTDNKNRKQFQLNTLSLDGVIALKYVVLVANVNTQFVTAYEANYFKVTFSLKRKEI